MARFPTVFDRIVSIVEAATPLYYDAMLPTSFVHQTELDVDSEPLRARDFVLRSAAGVVRPWDPAGARRVSSTMVCTVVYPRARSNAMLQKAMVDDFEVIKDALLLSSSWQSSSTGITQIGGDESIAYEIDDAETGSLMSIAFGVEYLEAIV